LENDAWPGIEHPQGARSREELDRNQQNREALVNLLRTADEDFVEIFGMSDGDHVETPKARESVTIAGILDPDFIFKEQGFYRVETESAHGRQT
jgi:hypothetical protein